jgi:hypothetical protein
VDDVAQLLGYVTAVGEPALAAGTPWWVAALLVVAPVVGTVLVARAPVWLEKVKQRGAKPEAPMATPPAAPADVRADAAFDLAERTLRDAWRERDAANRRAERLQDELDAEQDKNAAQAVTIAKLQAEVASMRGRRTR